jgi:hypothetical protein
MPTMAGRRADERILVREDMMTISKDRSILLAAVALCLAACGGGGGGGSGINSTPTPTPTPTPAPTSSAVTIFPGINVSTEFATIGVEANNRSPSTLTNTGFSVRYDASTGLYVMDFPSTQAGEFHQYDGSSPNATWWSGELSTSAAGWMSSVSVLKPTNPQLQLTYTTLAGYDTSGMSPEPFGWVAFGTATPAGAVPVTGSATYQAFVRGSSIDANYHVEGAATLEFNFGAGTLAGHLDPLLIDMGGGALGLGRYDFAATVFGVGSTAFSGQLRNPTVVGNGNFDGIFTGPGAQELMARWQAPYVDPDTRQSSTMFGVWVGKR